MNGVGVRKPKIGEKTKNGGECEGKMQCCSADNKAVKKVKNGGGIMASDALPLPVGLTNKVFFVLFFIASYFLMRRWREKIRNSTPLHVVSFGELVAIVAQLASFIYLLGFFGIDYVQNVIKSSDGSWELDDGREDLKSGECIPVAPCREREVKQVQLIKGVAVGENADEDIAAAVCNGSVASYSLESSLA